MTTIFFKFEELENWDQRFLNLAQHVSTWSKDPSTKVGSVITDDKKIVSVGFNGFPMGVDDLEERLNNRDLKYKMMVHAEQNALLFANRNLNNCTIYTYPFMPCPVCMGMIIQSGISTILAPKSDNERWKEDFKITETMATEAGIDLFLIEYKFGEDL